MAETSTFDIFCGRNVRGRNVQAETSVAEMSVAEMSEHQIFIPPKILSFLKTPKNIEIQADGPKMKNFPSQIWNFKHLFLFGTSHKSAC